MRCPLCNIDLLLSERYGVEIDYCPKCRGIWLDRGELDKIIDKAKSEYKEYKYYEYDNKYYKKKKRKSFFEEIFDFD